MSNNGGGSQPAATGSRTAALDDAIYKFWADFVRRQISVGRRDVARMLEVALEFFFERSTQLNQNDVRTRQLWQDIFAQVSAAHSATDPILEELVERLGDGDGKLPTPLVGTHFQVREPQDPLAATELLVRSPLAKPITQRSELDAYRGTLQRQVAAAEQMISQITERMVSSRKLVAGRLKELSPALYEHGMAMVSKADAAADRSDQTDDVSGAVSAAHGRLDVRNLDLSALARQLVARIWDALRGLVRGFMGLAKAREQQIDDALRVYQETAERWSDKD